MSFLEGEHAILNKLAEKGLPHRTGERCIVTESLYSSLNYDYLVTFDDGSIGKVKEAELTKLTETDIKLMEWAYQDNWVIHKSSGEIVKILKCDYILDKFEILFQDHSHWVVGIESLKEWPKQEQQSERKSWDKYFMDIAVTVSERATCDRLHVGCVIVKDKKIVSTGYNGSVSCQPHCDEIGHLYNDQGRCVRTIHAEQNAILYADREDLKGATAYVTHQPCENCAKLLVQSGVKRIIYKNEYKNETSDFFLNMVEKVHFKEE